VEDAGLAPDEGYGLVLAGLVVAMSWPWFLFTVVVFAQGSDISVFSALLWLATYSRPCM
jgi:hypothetical protein